MAWPNPFRQRDSNTRSRWGYTFQLTPIHLTLEEAQPLKFSYDVLGEECLDVLNQLSPAGAIKSSIDTAPTAQDIPSQTAKEKTPVQKVNRDFYLLLKENLEKHEKLQQLWNEVNTIPDWVDWDQIARGQDVFYRYGGAALTGLAYQSLLGGMGFSRVVEVLARTGGFSIKAARHRLYETTQHILECTRSLDSIKPGGAGFASSLRVRLLHAAVRQRIMKLAKTRPEYYNIEKYGVPINDHDCIATIGSFSASIIWLSLPRQGIWLRQQEIEDYIALWRLIAHYTGTPTEHFETPAKAKAIMESLLMNEVSPTDTSKILAANIIRCLEAHPPWYASRSFLEVSARWLNGNDLCDALGLGRPSIYYWSLMAGQCIFFMSLCYFYRSVPYLDRKKITALRGIFWHIIIDGKYGLGQETVFDFKYVPDYHITTSRGDDRESGSKEHGVERRNLNALVIAMSCIGVATYCGLWAVSSMLKKLF